MRAADPPAVAPAMSPTLGELDGGLVPPNEEPETPVRSDEVPVPVPVPVRESSESSDVELLWEVNKPMVLVIFPEDKDEVEVELGVSDEPAGAGVVEAGPGSGVGITTGGLEPVETVIIGPIEVPVHV
jgi:hypothetical protein